VVEWLRNALKTLSESDSRRLRRLETAVMEIQDDGEKFLRLAERINARLRGRARRADAGSDSVDKPDDGADDHRHSDVADIPRAASLGQSEQVVAVNKEELRARARARGLFR
jgi:hypothetical protein